MVKSNTKKSVVPGKPTPSGKKPLPWVTPASKYGRPLGPTKKK